MVAGTSAGNFLRLSRLVNSMVRLVYCLRGREHVSDYVKQLLGCTFETFHVHRGIVLCIILQLLKSARLLISPLNLFS